MTARVHDERVRRQQRFDLLEQEELLFAPGNQARRGRVQDEACAFDLGRQRRDPGVARGALGPSEGSARRLRSEAPHRDPRDHQLVDGSRRGREGRGVELGERTLGLVEAPDEEEAPNLEIPRIRGTHPVAVLFERRPGRVERRRRPAQVARGERDVGLGDDAPRAGHGLLRTEGPRRTSQEGLRGNEIAELRQRDAAKRESGASSRRATRFKAPRGSPAARARAAAVISESIGIPSHLSLPPFGYRRYMYLMTTPRLVASRRAVARQKEAATSTQRVTDGNERCRTPKEGEKSDDEAPDRDT
jgi:hypothetical protein